MLSDTLQDRAALYVAGDMTAPERDAFEVVLEFHAELRAHVAGLEAAVATVALARLPNVTPPAELKSRLLASLDPVVPAEPEALVVTDPAGLVLWVNDAFTELCGYAADELRGRKPGSLLQGPATDPAAVERIRKALRARQPCRESLVNYHKDGTRYRAEVKIAPVLADDGAPLWFVARERRLPLAAAS